MHNRQLLTLHAMKGLAIIQEKVGGRQGKGQGRLMLSEKSDMKTVRLYEALVLCVFAQICPELERQQGNSAGVDSVGLGAR